MTRIRLYISWLLMAAFVLTGNSMALARGMHAATGFIELCTGSSAVTVAVDAQGEPIEPVHICPECSLVALDNVEAAPVELLPVLRFSERLIWKSATSLYSSVAFSLHARGPPVLV
ncbi:MAG: hypothetical protein ACRBBQ_13485 [Cognatishimia sp.]